MPSDAVDCSRDRVSALVLGLRNDAASDRVLSEERRDWERRIADVLDALLARAEAAWEGSRSAAVDTAKAHVELVQVIAQRDAAVAERDGLRRENERLLSILRRSPVREAHATIAWAPECDCAVGSTCQRNGCCYAGKRVPENVRAALEGGVK